MKTVRIIFLLNLLLVLVACSERKDQGDQTVNKKEEALNEALGKFNKAFKDGDIVILDNMVTDTYRHTNSNTKAINKEAWFSYLHKRKKELNEGKLKVLSYEMDEKDIQYYDNLAIVTARVKVKIQKSGKEQNNAYRVTNIWIYKSGQWKRAGFHDGKIE